MVGRAHQRPGLHMIEPQRQRLGAQLLELRRRDIARHRQVLGGGPQVLAHGEHLGSGVADIAEGLRELAACLPQAHHQAGLHASRAAANGLRQQRQRRLVARARARFAVEPRDRLDVVGEDVGARLEEDGQRILGALEVGGQDLHLAVRYALVHCIDHSGEVRGAAVRQVVAIHRRDHRMLEVEPLHGLCQVPRFLRVHASPG